MGHEQGTSGEQSVDPWAKPQVDPTTPEGFDKLMEWWENLPEILQDKYRNAHSNNPPASGEQQPQPGQGSAIGGLAVDRTLS